MQETHLLTAWRSLPIHDRRAVLERFGVRAVTSLEGHDRQEAQRMVEDLKARPTPPPPTRTIDIPDSILNMDLKALSPTGGKLLKMDQAQAATAQAQAAKAQAPPPPPTPPSTGVRPGTSAAKAGAAPIKQTLPTPSLDQAKAAVAQQQRAKTELVETNRRNREMERALQAARGRVEILEQQTQAVTNKAAEAKAEQHTLEREMEEVEVQTHAVAAEVDQLTNKTAKARAAVDELRDRASRIPRLGGDATVSSGQAGTSNAEAIAGLAKMLKDRPIAGMKKSLEGIITKLQAFQAPAKGFRLLIDCQADASVTGLSLQQLIKDQLEAAFANHFDDTMLALERHEARLYARLAHEALQVGIKDGTTVVLHSWEPGGEMVAKVLAPFASEVIRPKRKAQ